MKLAELLREDLSARLRGAGLVLRTGPFRIRIRCSLQQVVEPIAQMYAEHPVFAGDGFCDFTIDLHPPRNLRRWFRPQVQAGMEGVNLFEPLPGEQAFALLEWTMNWWISGNAHQYLLLHAAVVERDGFAAILPAPPGSGKSTLCAALVQRGWRLLSDEMGMVDLDQAQVWPLARPVSLKNESLEVIRRFAPEAVLSEAVRDTAKGTLAHMKPKASDVVRMDESANPRWVVFPRYMHGASAHLASRPKADAMMELGRNAFNYSLLGRSGFDLLAGLVSRTDCLDFSYSRLDDALVAFNTLASRAAG